MTDITDKIRDLLVEHLGISPDQVRPEALLVPAHDRDGRVIASDQADLNCDSLDIVEIVMAVEERFGVEINDAESEVLNTGTVQDLFDLTTRKVTELA